MEGIKIDVTGTIARVADRPPKITSGTVGMPVEFTFDSQWDGLSKMAVFHAGDVTKTVYNPTEGTVVPWEVLEKPLVWLSIGVYGVNESGTVVIPTIWATVCPIYKGVDPEGDPTADPALPVWQDILNYVSALSQLPSGKVAEIHLSKSAWNGSGNVFSQVVALDGVTAYSRVDLYPSAAQLADFREKELSFTTENDNGTVTAYAIGAKPTENYTIQVIISEVEA